MICKVMFCLKDKRNKLQNSRSKTQYYIPSGLILIKKNIIKKHKPQG